MDLKVLGAGKSFTTRILFSVYLLRNQWSTKHSVNQRISMNDNKVLETIYIILITSPSILILTPPASPGLAKLLFLPRQVLHYLTEQESVTSKLSILNLLPFSQLKRCNLSGVVV